MNFETFIEQSQKFDMDDTRYQEAGERAKDAIRLLHYAVGLVTESAELLDMLKKHIFYGKDIDIANLIEEIGDSNWYNAQLFSLALEKAFINDSDDVFQINYNKLDARYQGKFSKEKAIERDLTNERAILEAGVNTDD